ncbi:hypothetical protein [Myxococcus sp. RHSTA-1-4]|uniref:hypothetical protein n=1 Tax=Myxococcus sp. RHSTA-1-4 TaxID=2874601 RepID=UPI001CC199FC|nr:hypothetical protein [Myxococcus sp. RHSTA-1-4]MBZ4422973.1 hypothetical protein [Myxococcus sp. RHSTA-1-4]
MDRIAFYGTLETGDSEAVSRLLRDWLRTERLDMKVGRVGVEIVHEVEGFYLYCHETGSQPGMAPFYLLEGHLDGTLDTASARLKELARLCAERSIGRSLEYVQVNEDGDELSEQFTVS